MTLVMLMMQRLVVTDVAEVATVVLVSTFPLSSTTATVMGMPDCTGEPVRGGEGGGRGM